MMTESNMKILEQGRAKYAYNCVKEVTKSKYEKEYKSYSKKILALIKTNGLGATLAFIKAKSSEMQEKPGYAYKQLYEQTAEWLRKDEKNLIELGDNEDLIEKIISLKSPLYRTITSEVIALFKWISRFAEGLIEGEIDK